ncbi:MAG: hypothetical protein GY765_24660, partial [bacterium]|nr:hypothetical protein [bacterium]
RYDGKSFTTFTEKEGLANNYVYTITEDNSGSLWFGTWGGGVSRYDGKSFTSFTGKVGPANNVVFSITEDKNGNLWFGTNGGGVNRYDGKSFTSFTDKEGLANNHVRSIIEDENGNLWFGTDGGGVSRYDGKSFTSFTEKDGLANNRVRAMTVDKNGNLWFGTWGGGVSRYDGKCFTSFTEKEGLANNQVRAITKDKDGNLWFGTWGGGVSRYDGKYFTSFTVREGLANNRIVSITEDNRGNLWFGTYGGGVNRYNWKSFTSFTKKEGLANNRVRSITEDKNGNLWFGTEGGGASRYDGKSLTSFTEKEGLAGNLVYSIIEDKNGHLWFGTWGGGVCRYDGKSFTSFTEKEGLASDLVWSVLEDNGGNLWIATENGGVSRYDGKSFISFTEKDGLADDTVFAITKDKNGNLWFATDGGGVSRYDGQSFTSFTEKEGLLNNIVWSITEDKNGNLWFATDGGGVSRYDGKSLTSFTVREGLANNLVFSIEEDKNGNLWIGTDGGLNCLIPLPGAADNYTVNKTSPLNHLSIGKYRIESLGRQDGLKAVDFFSDSVYIDRNNKIWWGSGKALIFLDLNTFEFPAEPPDVRFKSLDIQETFIDYRLLADSPKDNNFGGIRFTGVENFYNFPLNLELPYYLDHLTFHFSAIDWAAPHEIEYRYKLEGLDTKWSQPTKEAKAEYRNLPPGTFIFKVKAIGGAHKWSGIFKYEFMIHPPWWFTWWAYTGYGILVLVLMLLIVKLNTRRLVRQKEQLEHIVKERTAEIVNQKNEIEIQAEKIKTTNEKLVELDEFKQGMTGMIVHDLKNPLNAILSLTKNKSLERTSKQMLNMVLNILDIRKFEDSKMILELKDFSVYDISNQAVREVSFLSRRKNISIGNTIPIDYTAKIDVEIMKRIFVNLLTNGIKYSQYNGKINITCLKGPPGFLRIEISDSGEGIAQEKLEQVFEKFSQVKAKHSGGIRSTGLGLTFCKLAVEAHGGKIGVTSENRQGATFFFTLPEVKKTAPVASSSKSPPVVEKASHINLSDADKKILLPYEAAFKDLMVYETSKIEEILNEINEVESESLRYWLSELKAVIFNMNEEKYHELLDMIKVRKSNETL